MVLDTNIVVSAFRSRRGASNALLRHVVSGALRPLVTTALFLEYEDVLARPEHRLVTGMTMDDVRRVTAALAAYCEPVDVHFRWRPQLRDAGDELVLEATVNGQADALVTHNLRDFLSSGERFDLRIMSPKHCLQELRHD